MNVRLEFSFEFLAGTCMEQLALNHYFVDAAFATNTEDSFEQNVAFERMNYFVNEVLAGCVFVNAEDEGAVKELQNLGVKVLAIPFQPFDQIIGRLIFTKINAIMEDRIHVTNVDISSRNGAHLKYLHAAEEGTAPFDDEGWWNDPSPVFCNKRLGKKDKVVKIEKQPCWKDLGLDWEEVEEGERTVIVKFDSTTE